MRANAESQKKYVIPQQPPPFIKFSTLHMTDTINQPATNLPIKIPAPFSALWIFYTRGAWYFNALPTEPVYGYILLRKFP